MAGEQANDYFFIAGISALLKPLLANHENIIIDVDSVTYRKLVKLASLSKTVYFFISNDFDYYALRHLRNVFFIKKDGKIQEIHNGIVNKNIIPLYSVSDMLSRREHEMFKYLLAGLPMRAISSLMDISLKTCYAHRSKLIGKLGIQNRISLYGIISKYQ